MEYEVTFVYRTVADSPAEAVKVAMGVPGVVQKVLVVPVFGPPIVLDIEEPA